MHPTGGNVGVNAQRVKDLPVLEIFYLAVHLGWALSVSGDSDGGPLAGELEWVVNPTEQFLGSPKYCEWCHSLCVVGFNNLNHHLIINHFCLRFDPTRT